MDAYQETEASILEHPQALSLLQDATVTATVARGCERHLTRFLERYLPLFYRPEQRENATIVIEGLLSGLERKTCEPIAREHGVQRKPIQSFVGCSTWDDETVMAELRRHVKEELGDGNAVLVLDSSSFPKKGLALLALWFLVTQKGRMGGKRCGGYRSTDSGDLHASAARPATRRSADR